MRARRAALLATLAIVAVACGREGPVAAAPTNAPPPKLPPIAIPQAPRSDPRPVVWTERSNRTAIRVVMTPGRPIVGEPVRFDVKMSYGDPPYRSGGFGYSLFVDEAFGETLSAACAGPPAGVARTPSPPRPFDDNLHRTYAFYEPGPHTFSMDIHGMCVSVGGVSIERTFTVRGNRPATGLHRTGSDGQRQVDLLMSPSSMKEYRTAHLYAIFEDRTGAPFGWRVSYGDGRPPAVGGPACKPVTTSRSGRYERKFVHTWKHPAEYRLRVELSASCLSDPKLRGTRVIDEAIVVRPYPGRARGSVALPSHRYPPTRTEKLGPVKLVVGAGDCVRLERPDGERLQVLWPLGSRLVREPRGATLGQLFWADGKTRTDVRVIGRTTSEAIPQRCRFDDEAFLLAPFDL